MKPNLRAAIRAVQQEHWTGKQQREVDLQTSVPRGARRILLCGLVTAALLPRLHAAEPLTFTLREFFGTSHPDQLVEFELKQAVDGATHRMIDDAGIEVPFQVIGAGKKLVVRTDLPAGMTKTWKLVPGSPTATAAVEVVQREHYFEIANALTAVRVPVSSARGDAPAPIQGLRYRDGTWTSSDLTRTLLSIGSNVENGADNLRITAATTRLIERGPLKVVAQVAYQFASTNQFYTCTIELQAGQPSILIEDDGNVNIEYWLNLAAGLNPTEARYRHSSDQNPEAVVPLELGVAKRYGRMATWDPWAGQQKRGWSWQLYDANGGDFANLFGMFAGCASRVINGNSGGAEVEVRSPSLEARRASQETNSGGEVVTAFAGAAGKAVAGVSFRLSGNGKRVRIPWGIFLGVKGTDWKPNTRAIGANNAWDLTKVQGVNKQMNLHGGINLTKLIRYQLEDYPDPARGYGTMFISREALEAVVERARTDNAFYKKISDECASDRPVFELWRDRAGKRAGELAEKYLNGFGRWSSSPRYILDTLVHGYGIKDFDLHYWMGGGGMYNKLIWMDQLLARGDELSADQRKRLKAAIALFGGILWDDDFVPMQRESGLNLGTPNMPIQYTGMRHGYALFMTEHPPMKPRLAEIPASVREQIAAQVNEHGSHMGCTHYIGAAMWPTINTLLQLKASGVMDGFADDERMTKFAKFYLQIATPPEPRVHGRRVIMPTGDSEPDDSLVLAGMLATGFAESNPQLSARLMSMWRQSGGKHDNFYGMTAIKVDERLPTADPALGSESFPGYFSVLRSGWGSINESVLWLVAGDHYRDHRHDDHGEVICYALGAPLSLDFASMYTPRAASALVKSVVALAKDNWKRTPAPFDVRDLGWNSSALGEFASSPTGGRATATMKRAGAEWTRITSLTELAPEQPVFAIRDEVSSDGFVTSLNLFCEDEIETPEGKRKPGEGFNLAAGVTRLSCIGQTLPAHPSGGIDWDLFIVSAEPRQAHLSSWSHKNHIPTRQVILRLNGGKHFTTFIVPYRKGSRPDLHVSADGSAIAITLYGKSTRFDADALTRK